MAEDINKIFFEGGDCAFAFQHREHGAFFANDRVSTKDDAAISIFAPGFYGEMAGGSMWRDFSSTSRIYFRSERPLPDAMITTSMPALGNDFTGEWSEDEHAWRELCSKIEEKIADGSFEKIVPARFRSTTVDEGRRERLTKVLFHQLLMKTSADAFKFCYRSGRSVFFGATPELLFSRRNGKIFVPAIAGTRWGAPGDGQRGRELLASEKDLREHAVVVEGIQEIFSALGLVAGGPSSPQVLDLGSLVHLYTPIEAEDPGREKLSDLVLLNALHPTPAVGGYPRAAALEFLRKNEGWDRGLFAAPLLIQRLHSGDSLCLVAIRSALLTNDALYQFAGAGYVKGSRVEKEWEETRAKMNALAGVLFR